MIRQENLFPFLAAPVLLIVPIGIAVRGADPLDLRGNIVDFWVEAEVKSNIEPRHSPNMAIDDNRGLHMGAGSKEAYKMWLAEF
jgi:hypothetical protein